MILHTIFLLRRIILDTLDKINSTQRVEENRSTGKSDSAFAPKLFIYTRKDRRDENWLEKADSNR